jgi:hypothetical protein
MKTCEIIWNEFNEDKIFKKSLKIVISFYLSFTQTFKYILKDLKMT